jgi:hypothetical protein
VVLQKSTCPTVSPFKAEPTDGWDLENQLCLHYI